MKPRKPTKKVRPRKPCCSVCRHTGFRLTGNPDVNRPQFRCDKCGRTWTSGEDGRPYIGHEMRS